MSLASTIVIVSVLATQCAAYMDRIERELLRTRVSNMFDWSYDAYVRHAYPKDELLVRVVVWAACLLAYLLTSLYFSHCRVLAIKLGSDQR
jgi:hypothetical protein